MSRLVPVLLFVFGSAATLLGQSMGFVDVQRVLLEYKKTAEISEALDKRIAQARNEIRNEREKLKAMMDDLESSALRLSDEPLKRLEDEKKIALARIQLEIREKNYLFELERDLVDHMKKVFEEVRRYAEVISNERRLGAVFLVNTNDLEGRTREELTRAMVLRQVLYHDPALDLTSEIVKRLNG